MQVYPVKPKKSLPWADENVCEVEHRFLYKEHLKTVDKFREVHGNYNWFFFVLIALLF
jgi:hypothetical protein